MFDVNVEEFPSSGTLAIICGNCESGGFKLAIISTFVNHLDQSPNRTRSPESFELRMVTVNQLPINCLL